MLVSLDVPPLMEQWDMEFVKLVLSLGIEIGGMRYEWDLMTG